MNSSWFQAIVDTVVGLWNAVVKFQVALWVVIIAVLYAAWRGLKLVGDLTIGAIQMGLSLVTEFDGWSAPCGAGIGNYLAIANTFYPLDETLQMIAALLVFVWMPIGIYRFIKSWIPMMAGGS
jgi:hypothetical protein